MGEIGGRNCKKRVLAALFAALILAFCIFALVACNADESSSQEEDKVTYKLHLLGYSYDEETSTVTAVLSFAGGEDSEIDFAPIEASRASYQKNLWYNGVYIQAPLDPNSIFCAVRDGMPQEAWSHDEATFENLKVALRYDTIYKSIKTNGVVARSGRYYLHTFMLEEGVDSATFIISQTTQNSATWYSALIACGILLVALGTAAYLAVEYLKRQRAKNRRLKILQ